MASIMEEMFKPKLLDVKYFFTREELDRIYYMAEFSGNGDLGDLFADATILVDILYTASQQAGKTFMIGVSKGEYQILEEFPPQSVHKYMDALLEIPWKEMLIIEAKGYAPNLKDMEDTLASLDQPTLNENLRKSLLILDEGFAAYSAGNLIATAVVENGECVFDEVEIESFANIKTSKHKYRRRPSMGQS